MPGSTPDPRLPIPDSYSTASDLHSAALAHHQAGRLQVAEQLYRQILATDANNADAWHLLGVIAQQTGQFETAVGYISRAVQLRPALCGSVA